MSIDFACPHCQKKYQLKDELAGKFAKCAKCQQRIQIPVPVAKAAEASPDLTSWFDDELAAPSKMSAVAAPPLPARPVTKKCKSCGAPLADGAVLCVKCGFDLRDGKKRAMKRETKEPSRSGTAAKQTASLARGAMLSAIGAAAGAAAWVAVAVFTGYEIGWIAWGLGLAAGVGMIYGNQDSDGTTSGIVAAGIATLGILGAKFMLFEHLKSELADAGISADALAEISGGSFGFSSLFGPIDGLFILLAVGSAYKIGSGQSSD